MKNYTLINLLEKYISNEKTDESEKIKWKNILDNHKNNEKDNIMINFTSMLSKSLNKLEKKENMLSRLYEDLSLLKGDTSSISKYVWAATKRTLDTIKGFKLLIESENITCAKPLIRIQIDTALRFYSIFIVDDPHSYFLEILSGKQINHMQDSSCQKMRDAYLVNKLSEEYPWLKNIYGDLSGYIHFSNNHILDIVLDLLTEKDFSYIPKSCLIEAVDYFNKSIDIFIDLLNEDISLLN